MGVAQGAKPYLSMALGAVDASPLEMASAAGTIANDGVRMTPTAITLVTDAGGKVLEDHRDDQGVHALSSNTARLLTHMLVNVVQQGTGTAARLSDRPVAGKTGTSDGAKDGWFVGFTPESTTAVWVGNDDHTPTWGCYGGTLPASIWHDYMTAALPAPKYTAFRTLTGAVASTVVLCQESGMQAGPLCLKRTHANFDPSAVPGTCTLHRSQPGVHSVDAALQAHRATPKSAARVAAEATIAPATYEEVQLMQEYEQPSLEPTITRSVDDQGVTLLTNQ